MSIENIRARWRHGTDHHATSAKKSHILSRDLRDWPKERRLLECLHLWFKRLLELNPFPTSYGNPFPTSYCALSCAHDIFFPGTFKKRRIVHSQGFAAAPSRRPIPQTLCCQSSTRKAKIQKQLEWHLRCQDAGWSSELGLRSMRKTKLYYIAIAEVTNQEKLVEFQDLRSLQSKEGCS